MGVEKCVGYECGGGTGMEDVGSVVIYMDVSTVYNCVEWHGGCAEGDLGAGNVNVWIANRKK